MKMKKFLALSLSAVLAVGALAGCGSKQASGNATDSSVATNAPVDAQGTVYNIGICQIVQHVALDAATQGFKDSLVAELGAENVKFDEQNAQNDTALCATIANGFVAKNVDLILANATPSLQAAAAATNEIPILGTSVTEYGVALGIDGFTGTVGGNISGTSDLAPLDGQADMIKELFPNAKKVGLLYCSAEANSLYQVETVKGFLEKLGYTCTMYAFSDSNDISSVATKAVSEIDVLYVPTDNTVANNAELLNNITLPAGIPVIAGEEGICKGCGVATLSISYYDLGFATGKMAAKILKGEAKISEMPVEYAPQFTKKYNKEICDKLNITIPSDYVVIE